ncbi:MAG: hypothetical protein ACO1OF_23635 [Adhaeribacter sp.]
MESLNLTLFDIFGFVIPGGLILISLLLIFDIKSITPITAALKNISSSQIIFFVILAYVIGFVADNISYRLYTYLGPVLRSYGVYKIEEFSLEYRTRIHFVSPESFSIIERWNALKTFSYNLSFSFLILSIYFIKHGSKKRLLYLFAAVCIGVAMLLLNRAHMYDEYYAREIKEAVKIISTSRAK